MEESCPATPLVLTGRESKSPLQIALSSPESDGMKSPSPGSPDSRCVICLGRLQNKSFTDSCLHQFCFQCLLQWSKIKAECPLCKQPFKSIIHNVRSNLDYDQYHVEHEEPRYTLSDIVQSYNFDLIQVNSRFRYRSTMTCGYFRNLARGLLVRRRRLPENSYQINPLVPVDPAPNPTVETSNRLHADRPQTRARQRGTSHFRLNVYEQDLWVQNLVDITGRYRECSPQFYRENPAQIHRIIPWLNREVNVLISDCESHAAYVLSRIISLLTEHPIRSREFREQIQPYFGDRTEHFIHELYTFARSVYDIAGFDQNAVYGMNPNYATEVQEISSSSGNENDSDIEILETVRSDERTSKRTRQGLKKFILKRAGDEESKSEEPAAGPSGVGASRVSDSIDICESDPEEVKVLHYVKPEPEVVTLSSGEEAPAYSDREISNGGYAEVSNSEDSKLFHDHEKRRSRTRSGKGKCKSDGFGLKGKQKRKYINSRKQRDTSISSVSSSSSSSRSSSSSSTSSRSTSSSSNSSSSKSSYESRKWKSESSSSSKYSPRSSSKSKKKKCKKKIKKKICHKNSHKKHKSNSDVEKKRKKKVKSCVIVPNWSCDSSPTSHKRPSFRRSNECKPLKSYWSMALGDLSPPRERESLKHTGKRKHRESSTEDKPKRRNKEILNSSERSNSSRTESASTSDIKMSTSSDTASPAFGDQPSSSGAFSTSSSSHSLPLNSALHTSDNSD